MGTTVPVIYLLQGDDEYAIGQFVADIKSRLGDPSHAVMDIVHLDGRMCSYTELATVVNTIPFMATRRVVVLLNPTALVSSDAEPRKFISLLETAPVSTALVLVEYRFLTLGKDRNRGKIHWLDRWVANNPERVYERRFALPRGDRMVSWIIEHARSAGGVFSADAAAELAGMVGNDTRLADQEVQKLLAYVNYLRPVESDDVKELSPDCSQGDIFRLVDALGNQDGTIAMKMLQRLLEAQEPNMIFAMVVRQFRLLLLAREVIDRGGGNSDVMQELSIHSFVAEKVSAQARRFNSQNLEDAFRRLLDLDRAVKTGETSIVLALEMLIAEFTAPMQPAIHH